MAFATLGSLSGIAYRAGMGSATFVTVRAAIGAMVLLAVICLRSGCWVRLGSLSSRDRLMLGTAMAANATLNLTLFAAYGEMAVALVLAVYFTYPMLVSVASVLIGRERFTPVRSAGLLLAVAGLALIMWDQVGAAALTPLGIAWALAAAVCQASYLTVSRAGYTRVPVEQATVLMLAGGGLLAGAVALAVDLPAGRLGTWVTDPSAWGAVLVAGLLGAALAKVWLLRAVRLLGGTRTAVLMLFEPVVGVLLAAVVLAQAITLLEALGGLVILSAAVLVQRPAPGRNAPRTRGPRSPGATAQA
jgi:drug/metabolite transporter (DMT)-like permease